MDETGIIDFDRDKEEYHLKDIAFEMAQISKVLELRTGLNFSKAGKNLNEAVTQMRKNKERLIDEYIKTYGKEPDIEAAKRLFLRDQEAYGIAGKEAGVLNNVNPEP